MEAAAGVDALMATLRLRPWPMRASEVGFWTRVTPTPTSRQTMVSEVLIACGRVNGGLPKP